MKHFIQVLALFATVSLLLLTPACELGKKSDTVKFGAIVGLTGNSGSLGEDTRNGIQLAIDEQNARGGLLGKKIELVAQDSKTDPSVGVDIAKNMFGAGDKPIGVYSQSSVVTLPVRTVTRDNKCIQFAISGAEELLDGYDLVFRNWANPKTAAELITAFLKDSLHCTSLGIFYCNNDYGKSMQKFIAEQCATRSIEASFSTSFNEKDGEYKSLIAGQLTGKTRSVSAIYTVGLGAGLGTLIKQLRESGYSGHLISDITAPYPNVLNAAGMAAKGMYYLDFAFDPSNTDASTQEYVQHFTQKFGKAPLNFSVVSYEAMRLFFKAIETCGTFDSAKVAAELNKFRDHPGLFGNISVNGNEIIYNLNIKSIR